MMTHPLTPSCRVPFAAGRAVAVACALALVVALAAPRASAQGVVFPTNQNNVGGVFVDTDGTVKHRQTDSSADLAAQRLRAKAASSAAGAPGDASLTYVSLARLFAEVKTLTEQNKPLPDDVRFLAGLTQLRYVFVFPEEHDIVIAGPAEPFDAANKLEPTGKLTGRPVLHLDDLVVALRVGANMARPQPFGCSIDPAPDSLSKSGEVMQKYARASRGERMKAMKEALGPQNIQLFGAPNDSRFLFVTMAADYKLKRICLGVDPAPVASIGSPIDNTRAAGNRFWFEASYAPLLVSPGADAFEVRGDRLKLKCGALLFDDKGATDTAKAYARRFTEKIPQLCTLVPAFADLQNVVDLSLLASLIRNDRLAEKAGLDLAWILAADQYKPAPHRVPAQAETLVNFTNGSIVAGGVSIDLTPYLGDTPRETDTKGTLKPLKARPTATWTQTREPPRPAARESVKPRS